MAVEPASAGASAIASGAAAVFVAVVGVDPQSLFWGSVGSSIGVAGTEPTSRVRAVFVFMGTVAACALLARWFAAQWFDGADVPRNAIAMGLGMFFPIIKEKAAAVIPEAFDLFLRAIKVRK